MGINDEPSKQTNDLKKGTVRVAGEYRQIKSAVRKTAIGKASAYQKEKSRKHAEAVFKASLKKEEDGGDSSWESVEEDAPVIKLEELLGNMKIEDDDASDKEEEKEES